MMTMKNMNVLAALVSALFLLGFLSGVAQASVQSPSIVAPYLTFDGPQHTSPPILPPGNVFPGGGEDKLQDDSLTAWIDNDEIGDPGFGIISPGDDLWGYSTLSEINASGRDTVAIGSSSQIMILFATTLGNFGSGTGGSTMSLPNQSLLEAVMGQAGVTPGEAGTSANSIAVMLSTDTPDFVSAEDPLNWSANNVFPTAADWDWEATFDIVADNGDFFEFDFNNPVIPTLGGEERGSFTISSSVFAVAEWLPVDVLDFGGNTHYGEATFDQGTVNPASQDERDAGWIFRDQSSFFLNPIPEASSFAIWGLLTGIGMFYRRSRM